MLSLDVHKPTVSMYAMCTRVGLDSVIAQIKMSEGKVDVGDLLHYFRPPITIYIISRLRSQSFLIEHWVISQAHFFRPLTVL